MSMPLVNDKKSYLCRVFDYDPKRTKKEILSF